MRQSSRTPVLIMPSFHEVELPQIAFGMQESLRPDYKQLLLDPSKRFC
jgi:hypothetical protein